MMRARNERGQVIIMFAVLVPIFLAMLAFVVDVGQTYLENRNTQQVADSAFRTIEKIISSIDGGTRVALSDVPSGATSYSTYSALHERYPSTSSKLEDCETAIDTLKGALSGVDITQEFLVDGSGNLYYKVEVSKAYNAIMKIASADTPGNDSRSATAVGYSVIKFESTSAVITGGGVDG